jgi:hypothetical protein
MSTTQVTAGGIAAATSALAGGPKIDINTFKIGSSLTPPQPSDTFYGYHWRLAIYWKRSLKE